MSEPTNPFVSAGGKSATCMEMLQLFLDGEVTSEQREYFVTHMDHCMPCFRTYQVDIAIRQLLKDRCGKESAPGDLVMEIKARITQRKS